MASKKNEKVEAVEVENIEATEATEAPVEEKPEPEPVDLSGFESAVKAAIEGADATTGTVPEALVEAVKAEYQKLEGARGKSPAKALIAEGMTTAVGNGNLAEAQAYMTLQRKATVAGPKAPAPKRTVDPKVVAVEHLATIYLAGFLAASLVEDGLDKDEVNAEAQAKAQAEFAKALEFAKNEEAESTPFIKRAVRLASNRTKSGGVRTGLRRDLGAHIAAFIDTLESGQFATVAEIRKFHSGVYGSDLPSAGAISNRLRPKSGNPSTLAGVTIEERDGKLGIVKN